MQIFSLPLQIFTDKLYWSLLPSLISSKTMATNIFSLGFVQLFQ